MDFVERKDVGVLRAEGAVKRTEGTVFGAEIRVVDVAVDLITYNAGIVFLQAHLMRGHADADEVVGSEYFECLLFGLCQDSSFMLATLRRKSRFLASLG